MSAPHGGGHGRAQGAAQGAEQGAAHQPARERRPATSELERALGRLVSESAAPLRIEERRPSSYRSTFPVELLGVRRMGEPLRRIVLKDSSEGADHTARRVRASFLHDPLREIEVYRSVLRPRGLSAPDLVGAVVDPDRGRFWLFLEHVDGVPLWQVGEPEIWASAARWLADLHARFGADTAELPRRLLRLDAGYFRLWFERARSHAGVRGLDRLAESYDRAASWAAAQPPTFLHGEFYPSNVLVERRGAEVRIRPVDWEMSAVGTGLFDLAALVSGAWSEDEREALTEAYRLALPARLRPGAAELRRGVDRCRLLLAGQWAGWSEEWTPPPQHAHDWLATAFQLAAKARL
jgi:aminoglycoside phosphotransferase (APT) family kinase protein